MKPAPFLYERPDTLEEAASLLAEHGDDAKVLAGGQSLVPMLNFRLLRPSVIVDVNRVAELGERDERASWRDGPPARLHRKRGSSISRCRTSVTT